MNPPGRAQDHPGNRSRPAGRIGMFAWLYYCLCTQTEENSCLQMYENPSSWFGICSYLKLSFSNKGNGWYFTLFLVSVSHSHISTTLALLAIPGKVFSSCCICSFHDHTIVTRKAPVISKFLKVSLLLCHFQLKLPVCRTSCYKLVKCMTSHIMQLNFIPFLILYSQGHYIFLLRY